MIYQQVDKKDVIAGDLVLWMIPDPTPRELTRVRFELEVATEGTHSTSAFATTSGEHHTTETDLMAVFR